MKHDGLLEWLGMFAAPCEKCHRQPTVESTPAGYHVYCVNCYDADCVGDPPRFVSRSPVGIGSTIEKAFKAWEELAEEDFKPVFRFCL